MTNKEDAPDQKPSGDLPQRWTKGKKMSETKAIFVFLSAFAALCAIGLLFLRTDKGETQKVSKIIPMAGLYQYKWFKYLAALACLIISIIAELQAVGM